MHRSLLVAAAALALGGCSDLRLFVTPEGNIAVGPSGAATAAPGEGHVTDRNEPPPRHMATSAFDDWRPPPMGVLPPGGFLRHSSEPSLLQVGGIALTLRASDAIVPAWGGDIYLRVDMRVGQQGERPPGRDIAIIIDPTDHDSLVRARRFASAVFETLRVGDRGTVISTTGGQVMVPLVPFAGVPLLIERTQRLERSDGESSLAAGLEQAVALLGSSQPNESRMRRLIVFSGSRALIDAETRDWVRAATEAHVDVSLVPLTHGASERFERLQLMTQSMALPVPDTDDTHEHELVAELSALPEMPVVADDITFSIDSLPGPTHLIETAGAQSVWTPEGGEVPLGAIHAGEDRTFVMRGLVPSWRAGSEYELSLRVRWHDSHGDQHTQVTFRAQYSGSPMEYAESRNGDVLQYVSLLNTLSNVQAALTRDDASTFLSLRQPAIMQSRSLSVYALEHHDEIMGSQAALLETLLRSAPASWWLASN